MSRRGDSIDRARVRRESRAARDLPDLCTFVTGGAESRDDWGEVTTGSGTSLPNIPCEHLNLNAYERMTGGKTTEGATAKLQIPATPQTLLIDGTYSGVIAARGDAPAKAFQVTGQLTVSKDGWAYLAITI